MTRKRQQQPERVIPACPAMPRDAATWPAHRAKARAARNKLRKILREQATAQRAEMGVRR